MVKSKTTIIYTEMAKKKKEESPQSLKNVEETLSKTEQFLEQNYKSLLYTLATIVVLVGIFWLGRMYLKNRDRAAQSQIYQAERYFEMDSLNLALYGDGNYLGFLDISQDYKFTPTGNLALYCTGICYLNLGQYEDALEFLDKYSKKDKVIGSLAIGAMGDAYVELGDTKKGISKYLEAAEYGANSFNTPLFLIKAAELYELEGKYSEALGLYEQIQDEYPESTEGQSIEKYIARVKLLNE